MATISRNGYAVAIKKNHGVYQLIKAHKKFTKAQETLRKFLKGEPETNYVIIKELNGSVYEIYNALELKE